jgi:fumarate reductase subunit D
MLIVVIIFKINIIKYEPIKERYHALLCKMLGKKFIAWWIILIMFWYEHFVWQAKMENKLDWLTFLTFTCVVFGIDTFQKYMKKGE